MPVEVATYLTDLNSVYPLQTDGLNQTDDHLRLLKSTLQATFPNLNGAVTTTVADLNGCAGLPAAFATLKGSVLTTGTAGTQQAITSGATFGGPVSATSIQQGGVTLLPRGMVVMWAGSADSIPAGWLLCDGTYQTPDLRGRFVTGATSAAYTAGATVAYGVGAYGGSNVASFSTNTAGAHAHSGNTLGHALTPDELAAHQHGYSYLAGALTTAVPSQGAIVAAQGFTNDVTTVVGSNTPHTHGISSDGNHYHTVSADLRPAWYALAFIMKA